MSQPSDIISAMISCGQTPPCEVIADGQIHRYPVQNGSGRPHGKSGWYVLHQIGDSFVGYFGDWRKDTSIKFVSDSNHLDYLEQMQLQRLIQQANEKQKKQTEQQYIDAARRAEKIYLECTDCSKAHPYILKKNIQIHPGVKQIGKSVVIPVLSPEFKIQSLQYIHPDGAKRFLPKGKMKGGFFIIQGTDEIIICEGYATGSTLHRCTGQTVYVAFNAGNINDVARLVYLNNPDANITICGDNDNENEKNVGAEKSIKAANEIGCKWILPECKAGTDFNDLANESGDAAVKAYFEPEKKRTVSPKEEKIPEDILNPGGLIQAMMADIEKCSAASIPLFSLAAALTTVGSVIGQKLMTETGLRTNIYSMALGYSGTGKSGVMTYMQNMLVMSNAVEVFAHSEFTSPTAILQQLVSNPVSAFYVDEVGIILAGLKNPTAPEAGIPRLMTKLFSSTDRAESKGYADTKKNIFIPYHHMSFYGASPPEVFWDAMSNGQTTDGFLARMLVFEDQSDAPLPKFKKDFSKPVNIVAAISELFGIEAKTDTSTGNNTLFHKPLPNIIPKSDEAQEYFDPWALKYHNLKNQHKKNTSGISSIYARAAEHASKIALVVAASRKGAMVKEVSKQDIEYACLLVDFLINNVIRQVEENIADGPISKLKVKIIKCIKAYSEKNERESGFYGATIRDILRGPGQVLKTKDLEEILDSMVKAERIMLKSHKRKNGRSTNYYHAF